MTQLDQSLENVAASVESSIGGSSGSVSFSCLKENTEQVLEIFKDLLQNPEFRQDKIDLAKNQLRGEIARRNDEASDITSREFAAIVYGKNSPYGWDMNYEHIDRIQRDDLIAFYKRYFFPANIMLAVQGDFSAAEMRARIEKLLGDWDYKQPPVPSVPCRQRSGFEGHLPGSQEGFGPDLLPDGPRRRCAQGPRFPGALGHVGDLRRQLRFAPFHQRPHQARLRLLDRRRLGCHL